MPRVSWEVICFQHTVGQRSAIMQPPIHKVVRTGNGYFCRRVRRRIMPAAGKLKTRWIIHAHCTGRAVRRRFS